MEMFSSDRLNSYGVIGMVNKYSLLLTDHFLHPKNIGRLGEYTFTVETERLKDGDKIEFYVLLEDDRVKDISYTIQGCPRVIASASYTTEQIKGKTLDEILSMKEEDVRHVLGIDDPSFACIGLPLYSIQTKLKEYIK